jgi:hypothetical protein
VGATPLSLAILAAPQPTNALHVAKCLLLLSSATSSSSSSSFSSSFQKANDNTNYGADDETISTPMTSSPTPTTTTPSLSLLETPGEHGLLPLHHAVFRDYLPLLEFLLDQGPELESTIPANGR